MELALKFEGAVSDKTCGRAGPQEEKVYEQDSVCLAASVGVDPWVGVACRMQQLDDPAHLHPAQRQQP
jgi:hypothetical protein